VSTRILALRPGSSTLHEATVHELPGLLAEEGTVTWVDLVDPKESDTKLLADVFELHPVVIEDMLADSPTPKIERFDGYLYMVFHGLVEGAEKTGEPRTCDLDVFLGRNYLITSHGENFSAEKEALRQVRKSPELFRQGAAYLCYLLVEHLTERFLPLMERLDHEIDQLETDIVKSNSPKVLETVFDLKHKLQKLRRVGLHQKEMLNRLGRGDFELIPVDTRPFFRDAYDHFVRVVDLNDSFREIVSGAMDAYISMQSHRMNEIMKVLTLISTIMLPLTFIAGVYGMNFENMPELHYQYGYFVAIVAMVITAIGFFVFFRRKGWI
jgi:magnesium transporter